MVIREQHTLSFTRSHNMEFYTNAYFSCTPSLLKKKENAYEVLYNTSQKKKKKGRKKMKAHCSMFLFTKSYTLELGEVGKLIYFIHSSTLFFLSSMRK